MELLVLKRENFGNWKENMILEFQNLLPKEKEMKDFGFLECHILGKVDKLTNMKIYCLIICNSKFKNNKGVLF